MEYDNEENGFISVPAPEFGAIFMSNIATKRDCFKHKVFGLPSSMANFVKEVKKGMILFLFEYERRQLFGVYRALSDGGMNIVPHAFSSSGKQFSAQVRFVPIWYCSPLSEDEFRDAIRENYFSARKFHFGLSDEQVHRLLRLFSSRKLKNKLPPNGIDEDHIMVNNKCYTASGGFDIKRSNADLRSSLSRGYPRSFHGVKRVDDDMFPTEHREKDEDIVDSAEHLHYNDKKRRISYDEALSRDNAAEDKLHVHFLTEELGFSGDEWSSLNGRVKREHKINTNYTPTLSNYMGDSDLRRKVHDGNLVVRDQMVKENNMDSNFGLGRSNEHNGKPSYNDRTRLGTHYAGFLRNNHMDKAHSMDNSHEPPLSRKNKSDPFWNIGTASDDWPSSLDDRVGGKKSHLDADINSTIVSECFVNSPYNKKGMRKDGRLFRREISGNESKIRTGLRREFDHQEATDDDVCFLSRRRGANEKCVDSFLFPAASNGNSSYAGDVGRQMAEVGSYPMNNFDGLVPGTENFQRPLTGADCTVYSPMKKRTSGYSKFLAETEFPQSTEGQNLGPSCSKFHDATITRVMPYKDELPSSCYGHTETYEVEQGSNFVQRPPSSNVYRENNFASSKGISSPYFHPEFTKRSLESASEGGKMVLLRSHDGFNTPPLNVGISQAMEPNRSDSFGYRTAFIPRASVAPQLTRDDINEGETWRFSSQAAHASIARNSFSGNYQCADEELDDGHVIWQGSDANHVGRRSRSPNTSCLLQGNFLTNLDYANRPGADIVNDEYENNILTNVVHADSRNSRKSVFSRLSLAPKVRKLEEQEVDHSMSFDEHYMDTTVDEIMDLLYEDQKIVPKKPLNRKSFIRKVECGETNRSGKHAAVVKNDAEQPGDSMTRVLRESANEVLEETMNHILAETRMVDFKRRRETNRASEQTNVKSNKEEKINADEYRVLQNAQGNSSETAVAKDSADKPFKRRKLVRPSFDESSCRSDLNHQLPCQTLSMVKTGNSDSSEVQSTL